MRLSDFWKGRHEHSSSVSESALSDAAKELEVTYANPSNLDAFRTDAKRLRSLSDNELVYIQRLASNLGASAELTRRSMEATHTLNSSLKAANRSIYRLTALLTGYTAVLAILTLVLILRSH
jgi:hypothetical protein